MSNVADVLQEALTHHQAGRLPQAEQLYRQILQQTPEHPEALHLLGLLAHQVGQPMVAVDLISRAVQLLPGQALFFNSLGTALEAIGKTEQAQACYQESLRLDPNFVEAHNNLGILLMTLGRVPEAVMSYQRALQLRPDYAEAHNNLGNLFEAQRRLPEAIESYRTALRLRPELVAVRVNLGNVLLDSGRHEEALAEYRESLRVDPNQVDAYYFLGNYYRQRGQPSEARANYEFAIRLSPRHAASHSGLGVLLAEQGNFEAALKCYHDALAADPNCADAYNNLGNLLLQQGRLAEAETNLRRAVELRPSMAVAINNLGNALQEQGRYREACDCYHRALHFQPGFADAYSNLGSALHQLKETAAATTALEEALRQQPDHSAARGNLGMVLAEVGRYDDALAALERVQAEQPSDGRKIRIALLTRVIYESAEQMQAERRRITECVEQLLGEKLSVTDPVREIGATTFHLAYHGQNDRDIQRRIADLHLHASPQLGFVAPHCHEADSNAAGRPIRVGFVSRYLYDHPVGVHYAGAIANLARDRFHATVFRLPGVDDHITAQVAARADAMVALPANLQAARQAIADARLDVLLYTDIGMDPFTYFLAFSRLAKVQMVAAGHPVTSGIPAIDYFLSSERYEPPEAAGHYSERLIKLRALPSHFAKPPAASQKRRADFGLPDDWRLYVCGQTLFKIHPDFDALVGDILRADPLGRVILMEDAQRLWAPTVARRMGRSIGDVFDRVLFLPRLSLVDFIALNRAADAVLDTTHFSGGTTTFHALLAGAAVVTLPGAYMRGRVTAGCYDRLGISDCTAADRADYVRIATRLANDRPWQADVRQRIAAASHLLVENTEFVRELEQVLVDLAEGRTPG